MSVTYTVYGSFLNATDHNDVRKFASLCGTSSFPLFQLYFCENEIRPTEQVFALNDFFLDFFSCGAILLKTLER
jgi:hypothetical protein